MFWNFSPLEGLGATTCRAHGSLDFSGCALIKLVCPRIGNGQLNGDTYEGPLRLGVPYF